MSRSGLLSGEYSSDEEFTLNQVHYEEDLEAPSSLLLENIQNKPPVSMFGKITTYDRTMWRWTNVENMDTFFQRVYEYYEGKGIYCILLARLFNLL